MACAGRRAMTLQKGESGMGFGRTRFNIFLGCLWTIAAIAAFAERKPAGAIALYLTAATAFFLLAAVAARRR